MKRPDWNLVLSGIDEDLLQEALSTYGQRETSLHPVRKDEIMNRRSIRRINRTGLIAAVLALALAVGALAAGISIHRQRQEELRQDLNIDAANVGSYVEYETSDAAESGVTLLSAIRDKEWQTVYVNVSPVEKEDAAAFANGVGFAWSIDGVNWGSAVPVLTAHRANLTPETMGAAVLEDAYDEESKTLSLSCVIWMEQLEEGKSTELQLVRLDEESYEKTPLGSVWFTPTAVESRNISFTDGAVTDKETGKTVAVERMELTPLSVTWYLSGEDDLALEDRILSQAVLHFSDGSTLSPGCAVAGTGETGLYCTWNTAIDIQALESVTFGGVTLNWK